MRDAEIVKDFLVESHENLDQFDRELILLEKDPGRQDLLASIFRAIHTIKGTSGFLAFTKLEALTHVGENLLAQLRDGALDLTPDITTTLLGMVDTVRQMLAHIEAEGEEGERNDQELIISLTRLIDGVPPAMSQVTAPEAQPRPSAGGALNIGDLLVMQGATTSHDIQAAVEQQNSGDPRHLGEILVDQGSASPQDVLQALNTQQQMHIQHAGESTIRVDVSHLDRLMNRVGELVLLRNQILQYTHAIEDERLQTAGQRLNLLTTELQEGVMKTRMQPIGNIWSKFPRTVRDVAVSCGKQVRIEMQGKETELDKTIIEAVKDPLTHLLRNAVDHGIETPEARRAAGKDPEGRVLLRAFHEGGQVNIEITDDGAGLDLKKIRDKAIEKALISADHATRMSEREMNNLIFLPGLSTATAVTNVSGRGVGMDVVRTNIEKIGGTVDLQSRPGQGCTVRMKIPLTLAIIPALIVTTAGDRYAIPQVSLLELVRFDHEQLGRCIEFVQGAPVHRLRGRLLPLICLDQELSLRESGSASFPQATNVDIVVLRADDRQFGLVVDEINDTEEIVVKPLSKQLKSVNIYAGATIMGDGAVALILDVLGLAQRAGVINEIRATAAAESASWLEGGAAKEQQRNSVLLFQCGRHGRMAIDLAQVSRLEEFPADAVEKAAGGEVMQYRGEIMPLVRVSRALEGQAEAEETQAAEAVQVVVYAEHGRSVGLVVDQILDIVEESFVVQTQSRRPGVLGSAIIQKRVTDILDVPALLTRAGRSLQPFTLGAQA